MGRKKKEETPKVKRSVVFVKDIQKPERPKKLGRFKCCG